MNRLLAKLMADGTMKHRCVAFGDESFLENAAASMPTNSIMDMGKDVRPGPYWSVHPEDEAALVKAGYRLVYSPTSG